MVTEAVRVSAQAGGHDGRWRGPRQRAGAGFTAAQRAGQLRVHQAPSVWQEVLRVASVGPSQASRVGHTSRRQRKNRLARLVRRNRCHKPRAKNRRGGDRSHRRRLRGRRGFGAWGGLLVLVDFHVNSTATYAYPAVAGGARAVRGATFVTVSLLLIVPVPAFPLGGHGRGWGAGVRAACPRRERLAGGARHSETRLLSAWDARRRILLIWRFGIRFEAGLVIDADVAQFQRARFRFLFARSILRNGGQFGRGRRVRFADLRAGLRQQSQRTFLGI